LLITKFSVVNKAKDLTSKHIQGLL